MIDFDAQIPVITLGGKTVAYPGLKWLLVRSDGCIFSPYLFRVATEDDGSGGMKSIRWEINHHLLKDSLWEDGHMVAKDLRIFSLTSLSFSSDGVPNLNRGMECTRERITELPSEEVPAPEIKTARFLSSLQLNTHTEEGLKLGIHASWAKVPMNILDTDFWYIQEYGAIKLFVVYPTPGTKLAIHSTGWRATEADILSHAESREGEDELIGMVLGAYGIRWTGRWRQQ